MEIKKIRNLEIALVPEEVKCDKLTKKNAEVFYTANTYSAPILKDVVSEFETALKDELGINGKIPKETIENKLEKGGIKFKVQSVPSTSTSYQSIGLRIEQYLEDIQELNEEGRRREGVRTIDEKAYINTNDLNSKIEELLGEYTTPKVNNKITCSKMIKEADLGRVIDIEPGTYDKVTGENAKTYRIAKEQTKLLGKNVINAFKNALKSETGWSKDNVPEETQKDMYEVGKYVFLVTTSPKENVKYGDAAKGFISFVKNSGEFVRRRDDNEYLPVDVLVEKYNDLVEENTNMTVQQDIAVMPQPRYDQVLVD